MSDRYSVELLTKMVKYVDPFGSMTFETDGAPGTRDIYLLWSEVIRSTGFYRWIRPRSRVELARQQIVEHFRVRGETVKLTS